MKIEKISDNQIRCTLSHEDLIDRELRISELAYGTEKAKALFRDMMQQANYEFGFDAEDIPLMIEAIPVSPECLVLVITKVEDPEELDTRFSKFSPDDSENYGGSNDDDDNYFSFDSIEKSADEYPDDYSEDSDEDEDEDDDIRNFLPAPKSSYRKKQEKDIKPEKSPKLPINIVKIYSFQSLEEVIEMSSVVSKFYNGENSLYKNPVNLIYYLVANKSEHTTDEFNKIGNLISEYGQQERSTYASPHYYEEHFDLIIKDNTIQVLSYL